MINRANTYDGLIRNEILNNKSTKEDFESIFNFKFNNLSPLNSMSRFDTNTLLPALLHVEDRVSMAHGIEARVPFLDHEIVEFAGSIPTKLKFQNGELKSIIKKSFKTIPKKILQREDKMGFPIPLNLWIKEDKKIKEFVLDIFKSKKALERNYFSDNINIEKIIDKQSEYSRTLWALISLELWQQKFIDQ